MNKMVIVFVLPCLIFSYVEAHGRMLDPPSRSSMWRFGFKNPINYNDNELFCGGFDVQWSRNGGKCGICGDPWDQKPPRPHEDGGKYGNGIITKTYKSGQTVKVLIDITANHLGYFEFRICPIRSKKQVADQSCLDQHVLSLADGSGTKYHISPEIGYFVVELELPAGLRCKRCILQWHYYTANNWAKCSDSIGRLGCGPQETFRACADVQII